MFFGDGEKILWYRDFWRFGGNSLVFYGTLLVIFFVFIDGFDFFEVIFFNSIRWFRSVKVIFSCLYCICGLFNGRGVLICKLFECIGYLCYLIIYLIIFVG